MHKIIATESNLNSNTLKTILTLNKKILYKIHQDLKKKSKTLYVLKQPPCKTQETSSLLEDHCSSKNPNDYTELTEHMTSYTSQYINNTGLKAGLQHFHSLYSCALPPFLIQSSLILQLHLCP